jgi:hypothetical protein
MCCIPSGNTYGKYSCFHFGKCRIIPNQFSADLLPEENTVTEKEE